MRIEHIRRHRGLIAAGIAATVGAALALDARAADFTQGSVFGSWDTTISYGQSWRVAGRDCNLIATADGGCGRSPNIDDGDLNYSKGLFSTAAKIVSELSLHSQSDNLGVFVRGSALEDFDAENDHTERTPLSRAAKDLVGSYVRLLDLFGYARFDMGSMPAELRLGRQVLSWGESTFIQGGLNVINHFDVAALRVPGSELKEAFLPQEMAVFNLQLTDRLSTQLVYITDWNDTRPEPAGSYFSTNDFAVPGGRRVVLGFGAFSDQGVDFRPLGGPLIPDFQNVNRLDTREPRNGGQYGLNLKLFLPDFNNGTELGFYFLNYHSRLPVISGRTGTQAGLGNAFGALTAVGAAAQGIAAGLPIAAAVATATQAAVASSQQAGGNLAQALAQQYATIGANTLLAGGDVTAQATNIATHEYAKTAGYFTEFPEDIHMLGVSFNTQLQATGTALQGEVAWRENQPLQFDDVELLFAALAPLESGLATLRNTPLPAACLPGAGATLTRCNQLGVFGLNQEVRGWSDKHTWQAQFTATQTFANIMRASQLVLVFEGAVDYIPGLENKLDGGPTGRGLRYNGPGTSVSGNAELAGRHFGEVEPQDRFPDRTSWGYRLAGRLEYPNLLGAWNILPRFSWSHDVNGTSPGPGGNFVEGRKGLTLGVSANLRATYELDVAWTQFSGAGRWNDLNDRDFVSASVKVSF
ncbi:MAG TPA: DUF1302 domain-containing protein [Steroidobacteraceae bacterium]|nr:DUF1302 domain-containing protein [Steroidobacteraceae bacterium]